MESIELAHVANITAGTGGGGVQATQLLEQWVETDGIEPWGVHATNLNSPENLTSRKREYPIMYPSSVDQGIREIDPDVVFVHGFSPQLNRQLRDLAAEDDIDAKFVLRNGMNLYEHWGMALRHNNHQKLTHQITEFDWYDLIVCPTQAAAARTQLFYGERCPDLSYIPNGIHRSAYVPSSFMLEDTLKVITVSRGGPNDFLLAPLLAVARIAAEGEIPIEMQVFGASHPALSTAMHEIAEAYDAITIAGYIEHDRVRDHLEVADVVCVPSVSHQAVPQAAIEGLAAGNVVLCGDFFETHEEDALIRVPVAHPPAWHEAITDVHDDPDDAREWIRGGIERAADYDIERIVQEGYLPAFRELVEGDDADADAEAEGDGEANE